jgi:hypothetical protein
MFRSRRFILRDSSYANSINSIAYVTYSRLNMKFDLYWISVSSEKVQKLKALD